LLTKIGKNNLDEMKKNNNNTLVCFYCNKEHYLNKEDFKEIYEMIEKEGQKIEIEKS
jgi:redox-regulated HSP33 family molecular chaperone